MSCTSPFERANPYDPNVVVEFSIEGPDTVFAVGEPAHFVAHVPARWANEPVSWKSGVSMSILTSEDNGTFVVTPLAYVYSPKWFMVSAEYAGRARVDSFVLFQRVKRFTFTDCPECFAPNALGKGNIGVIGWDANGYRVRGLFHPGSVGAVTSSDPSVLTVEPSLFGESSEAIFAAKYTALKNGSAWIVINGDGIRDSAKVTVQQFVTSASISPACPATMQVGQTIKFSVTDPKDPRGNPVPPPVSVTWRGVFQNAFSPVGSMTITNDGSVTATGKGYIAFGPYYGASNSPLSSCLVVVT